MSIPLRRLSLAVVLVLGGGLIAAVPGSKPSGPPEAAANIVNIDSMTFPSGPPFGSVPISKDAAVVVYDVPQGRWLLLTDVEIAGQGVELVEISGPTTTVKRGQTFTWGVVPDLQAYHSNVGLAFAPGTQVGIRNVSGADTSAGFTLTGRLVKH